MPVKQSRQQEAKRPSLRSHRSRRAAPAIRNRVWQSRGSSRFVRPRVTFVPWPVQAKTALPPSSGSVMRSREVSRRSPRGLLSARQSGRRTPVQQARSAASSATRTWGETKTTCNSTRRRPRSKRRDAQGAKARGPTPLAVSRYSTRPKRQEERPRLGGTQMLQACGLRSL